MEQELLRALRMTMKRALQVILGIGLFGLMFSGTLSYQELFGGSAEQCPAPGPAGTVLGYPACVYGLFMYALISGIAAWGLRSGRKATARERAKSASIPSTRASHDAHDATS